jgi:hypothetical protein
MLEFYHLPNMTSDFKYDEYCAIVHNDAEIHSLDFVNSDAGL